MDLDSSLDDIIKNRKQANRQQSQKKGQKQQAKTAKGKGRQQINKAGGNAVTNKNNSNKQNSGIGRRNGAQSQKQRGSGNLGVKSNAKAKINKPTQRNASNINARLTRKLLLHHVPFAHSVAIHCWFFNIVLLF
ncbi:hypothetical protein BX666DRAFT_1382031 [Dichotomocladium elegans]|nr:hypothetical protein BX666DRAFT_1382031 [Dichotomocladium elegans]